MQTNKKIVIASSNNSAVDKIYEFIYYELCRDCLVRVSCFGIEKFGHFTMRGDMTFAGKRIIVNKTCKEFVKLYYEIPYDMIEKVGVYASNENDGQLFKKIIRSDLLNLKER